MIDPSVLLSIFAIMVLVFYVPAIINPKLFRKEMTKIAKDHTFLKGMAVVAFIFAILFFSVFKKIESSWMTLFTILGWLAVIKGTFLVWFPETGLKIVKKLLNSNTAAMTMGITGFLFAIFLKIIADFYI
ncbi:hypothetical protein GF354_00030 [Candidatus Peregrinibacteria bacterium]|nr:hypothetical protein [Candidatus Peregrinibacteria bacterium]